MPSKYFGHYHFKEDVVRNWQRTLIGVYYCGYINSSGNLEPRYIGRAIGDDGIRGRLLEHLSEKSWMFVTHFGFIQCSTAQEAVQLEAQEIKTRQPYYNIQGK